MPEPPHRADGLALRRLREARGLTKYALGKASGVAAQLIGRFEAGRNTLTLPTLRALCRALGCSLAEFDGGGGP